MIIKCGICGGDIHFRPGDVYGQCDYCGRSSMIPRANDEQRGSRDDRGGSMETVENIRSRHEG